MNIFDVLSHAITPIVVLILGIIYKNVIIDIFRNYEEIPLNLPASMGKVKLSSKQAGEQLSELFTAFNAVYIRLLKSNQIKLFSEILKKNTNQEPLPTVKEMIPDFNREDPAWEKTKQGEENLGRLRALRGLGLIVPVGTKSWQANSKIEITPFGKALTVYMKNQR